MDEDANNKFSESKDHSSKLPRNISEKRMLVGWDIMAGLKFENI